jgi:hypothetical protein
VYLYCHRAWWYQSQGIESGNQAEMAEGSELHRRHSLQVARAGLLRAGAMLLLLVALALLAVYLTGQFL